MPAGEGLSHRPPADSLPCLVALYLAWAYPGHCAPWTCACLPHRVHMKVTWAPSSYIRFHQVMSGYVRLPQVSSGSIPPSVRGGTACLLGTAFHMVCVCQ